MNSDYSELFIGISLKSLFLLYKEKVLVVLKAVLMEKRIIVYSNKPSSISSFILGLLALLPGGLHFNYDSLATNIVEVSILEFNLDIDEGAEEGRREGEEGRKGEGKEGMKGEGEEGGEEGRRRGERRN